MEAAVQAQEVDTLSDLEERITRAVQAITTLRSENQQLQGQLSAAQAELAETRTGREEAQGMAHEFQQENGQLEMRLKQTTDELNGLRGERKQVKARIEKLLGQLDLLGAS